MPILFLVGMALAGVSHSHSNSYSLKAEIRKARPMSESTLIKLLRADSISTKSIVKLIQQSLRENETVIGNYSGSNSEIGVKKVRTSTFSKSVISNRTTKSYESIDTVRIEQGPGIKSDEYEVKSQERYAVLAQNDKLILVRAVKK